MKVGTQTACDDHRQAGERIEELTNEWCDGVVCLAPVDG
jgi:hypothetical protein